MKYEFNREKALEMIDEAVTNICLEVQDDLDISGDIYPMDALKLQSLEETLVDFISALYVPRVETVYSPSDDVTYIWENSTHSMELVGWYFGEPNIEDTEYYNGKLKANYRR